MIGAIAGDIIGSVYERKNIKTKDFHLFAHNAHFTDDTVLTVALADSILTGTPYAENLRRFYHWYPRAGYGGSFHRWANDPDAGPYNSWGNGAAMRISPVGYAFDDLETVLEKAREFTEAPTITPRASRAGKRRQRPSFWPDPGIRRTISRSSWNSGSSTT